MNDGKTTISGEITTRFSEEELEGFRELVNKFIDSIEKEITELEIGYQLPESERESLCANKKERLKLFEEAKVRIDNKTFGICSCGNFMDDRVLRVFPHATNCNNTQILKAFPGIRCNCANPQCN